MFTLGPTTETSVNLALDFHVTTSPVSVSASAGPETEQRANIDNRLRFIGLPPLGRVRHASPFLRRWETAEREKWWQCHWAIKLGAEHRAPRLGNAHSSRPISSPRAAVRVRPEAASIARAEFFARHSNGAPGADRPGK